VTPAFRRVGRRAAAAASAIFFASLSGGCAGTGGAGAAAAPGQAEGAALEAVVDAIQRALSESEAEELPGFPPLRSVTVKLQTVATRSVGGEIAVYVFSLESHYTAESASTVELKLAPPSEKPPRRLRPEELTEALARSIHAAKVAAARAASGKPSFVLTAADIDVKFTVEATGGAGAKVTLVPLGAEAGGKVGRNQVQTITLSFAS